MISSDLRLAWSNAMNSMAAVALLALGCTAGPHEVAGDGALLESVAIDQSWIAFLGHDTRYPNGTHNGRLSAQPVTGGAAVLLDGNSSGGTFERGRALWYLGGVSIVQEGTPLLPHFYGSLNLWLPGLTSGIKVGSIVRDYSPSQNGSTVVFMDFATASQSSPGKLVAVAASTCGTGTCQPIVIAENILVTQASWRISSDGKYVLATVKAATMGDPGLAVLVQPATGDVQVLSQVAGTRSPTMSEAGDAIAWVEGVSKIMTTPTAQPKPAQLKTTADQIDGITMVGPQDFVAKARALDTTTGMFGAAFFDRVTTAGTVMLDVPQRPAEFFVSQYVPGTTTKYLFYSTATDSTTGTADLWVFDLTKSTGPVQIATRGFGTIGDGIELSDDGGTLRWFDDYDPTTRLGDLYVTPLTSPARNLMAVGVRSGAFEPGTTRLLYINAPDPNSGAGVLTLAPGIGKPTLVEGVGLLGFADPRSTPARTFYTQRSGGPGDGVWYMSRP